MWHPEETDAQANAGHGNSLIDKYKMVRRDLD